MGVIVPQGTKYPRMRTIEVKIMLLISLLLILAIDYAILAAILYAICWCLSIAFSWKIALGIWLIIIVIKLCFGKK